MCRAWHEMEQVTIAAIEGFCIGGGAALAVSLDFRVCARGAHFRIPEVALGMNMSWGSIPRMLQLMGPARTKQAVILASERIQAEQAYEWGLVEHLAEDGSALAAAMALANRIAAEPPLPGQDDEGNGQPPVRRARRSREPHGSRPVRADDQER